MYDTNGSGPISSRHTVVCVDDEPFVLSSLHRLLAREDYTFKTTEQPNQVLDWIEKFDVSLVITDQKMDEMTGTELVKAIKIRRPDTLIAVITGYPDNREVNECIKSGLVIKLISKPWNGTELKNTIVELLIEKERQQGLSFSNELVGSSQATKDIRQLIDKVGPTGASVLITGETGTGKEVVARAIHNTSHRRRGPFIAVNCGSIPETLLESILFGHVKGAYTGADKDKQGLLETAGNGTILLDEIGELPLSLQPKILRAIETREILPVGSTVPVSISARILAATNRNLKTMMQTHQFRSDLYYRLDVFEIHIPPLRERPEDIYTIVTHLIERLCKKTDRPTKQLDPEAIKVMQRYPWPGNVRELANALERSLILAKDKLIKVCDLPESVSSIQLENTDDLNTACQEFEKEHLIRVLAKYGNNKLYASKALGINLSSLYRKMNQYKIR